MFKVPATLGVIYSSIPFYPTSKLLDYRVSAKRYGKNKVARVPVKIPARVNFVCAV